MDYECIRC